MPRRNGHLPSGPTCASARVPTTGSSCSTSRTTRSARSCGKIARMNKLFVIALLGTSLAAPAFAQQGQQPQAPPTTSAFLRNMYNGNKNNIIRSAEKVTEDLYGLRPGPQV